MHSQQASIRAARLTKIAMDCVPDALSGRTLYGDDFSPKQIARWFSEEEEAYYRLARRNGSYCYYYHARNIEHGYRHLPRQEFGRVLGIGSAYGDELAPILQQCREITILEPSDGFRNERFAYTKPHPSGTTPFPDENFDLVTCLGVLHHVPNVSKLLREIGRVLKPSGYVIVSEPIISMGDWTKPRRGLTKNERGIPIALFRDFIHSAGLYVVREHLHSFALTSRWSYVVRQSPFNVKWIVKLDSLLCSLPIWFRCYHPRLAIQKLRATAVFFVLKKS